MNRELRIGNLLHYNIFNETAIVRGIGTNCVWMGDTRESGPVGIECFSPILITTEWLLKLGFKDNEYTMNLQNLEFSWYSRIVSTGERSGWSCELYPHIKYVHQLQNLYLALTGEELITH